MAGPHPAVAAARLGVRQALTAHGLEGSTVLVACSGGADSLALAAAAAFVLPRTGGRVGAVVVDHGLQEDSVGVARAAADQCRALGLDPVTVVTPAVEPGPGGPEEAARAARHEALAQTARAVGAAAVLLGHTRDDQAEQVLLGLARGSGTRSLSGMPSARALPGSPRVLLLRPLLGLARADTEAVCAELGLPPWEDPHNSDQRFARVRARAALRDLEQSLGPGLSAALARSADLLRDDADVLQGLADTAYRELGDPPWSVPVLADLHPAVRRRLWQRLATEHGSPPGALTAGHLRAVDDLLTRWHGQGPIALPGGLRAHRGHGLMWLEAPGAG